MRSKNQIRLKTSKTVSKRIAGKRPANRRQAARKTGLGSLPEWNLADLYSGLDDPAIKRDLDRADAECIAFEDAYKGKLADMAKSGSAALREGVRRYEAIDDLPGRLGSYARLVHAGNTVDPQRTKFYGDVQERLTAASIHLLFFSLELNRIDDAVIEAAMSDPALGHYRPWIEDVRRYRPYQLEDRVEQLFHEKSMTAASAWNRQFDATIANLRFKVLGKTLAIEPTLKSKSPMTMTMVMAAATTVSMLTCSVMFSQFRPVRNVSGRLIAKNAMTARNPQRVPYRLTSTPKASMPRLPKPPERVVPPARGRGNGRAGPPRRGRRHRARPRRRRRA